MDAVWMGEYAATHGNLFENSLDGAGALEALAARGHTVIASLDSDGLSEAAFEAAFSRSVVLRNGRVLYCGETRRAAAHSASGRW